MNNQYRKTLPDTQLEYFDVRQAVEDIQPALMTSFPILPKYLLNNWCAAVNQKY